jgi:glycosyltransferase involved in cell wall biosynthesis
MPGQARHDKSHFMCFMVEKAYTMKIVHIITRLILGGAQENTLITCKLLAQRGHEVTLITGPAIGPEGALFEQTKNADFETIVVDELRREINPLIDIPAYFKLKKILRELQPDIVHTHSAKAGILGRYAGWALKLKRSDTFSVCRPLVVHTIHGLAFHKYQNPLLSQFYIAIEKATAQKTDAFITVADTMTEKAKAAGIGLGKPYTTAYSAIEEDAYLTAPPPSETDAFRAKYDIPVEAVVFVKVARLFELKGHEYVIESARRIAQKHDNCYWLFVGDGMLAEPLKNQIQFAGLEGRFKFTGLVPPEQIPLCLHASDVLVHCSLREGLARVLPQAMLCGKPVVSFDIDGAKEVVNENTGLLIEPENIDQLTAACEKLLENPDLRRHLGQNGKAAVTQQFAPETMVNAIETVYQKSMETLNR